jgi:DNA-directed RNA polymerase subunit N (RpoN/RPB10)
MLIPIRCLSCGQPINDIAIAFNKARVERVKKELKDRGTVSSQVIVDASIKIEMGDVLDDLGIEDDCCRRALTAAMDIRDHY